MPRQGDERPAGDSAKVEDVPRRHEAGRGSTLPDLRPRLSTPAVLPPPRYSWQNGEYAREEDAARGKVPRESHGLHGARWENTVRLLLTVQGINLSLIPSCVTIEVAVMF